MVYYFIFRSKLPVSLILKIISFFIFPIFCCTAPLFLLRFPFPATYNLYLIYFFVYCRAEAAGEVAGGDAPAADAAPAVSA